MSHVSFIAARTARPFNAAVILASFAAAVAEALESSSPKDLRIASCGTYRLRARLHLQSAREALLKCVQNLPCFLRPTVAPAAYCICNGSTNDDRQWQSMLSSRRSSGLKARAAVRLVKETRNSSGPAFGSTEMKTTFDRSIP